MLLNVLKACYLLLLLIFFFFTPPPHPTIPLSPFAIFLLLGVYHQIFQPWVMFITFRSYGRIGYQCWWSWLLLGHLLTLDIWKRLQYLLEKKAYYPKEMLHTTGPGVLTATWLNFLVLLSSRDTTHNFFIDFVFRVCYGCEIVSINWCLFFIFRSRWIQCLQNLVYEIPVLNLVSYYLILCAPVNFT